MQHVFVFVFGWTRIPLCPGSQLVPTFVDRHRTLLPRFGLCSPAASGSMARAVRADEPATSSLSSTSSLSVATSGSNTQNSTLLQQQQRGSAAPEHASSAELSQAVGDILGRLGLPLSLDQKELLSRNLELQASEKGGRLAAPLSSAARSSSHCAYLRCLMSACNLLQN